MPKAAIDKDCRSTAPEHEIRSAEVQAHVQPIPQPLAVERSAKCHLGSRVLHAYPGHLLTLRETHGWSFPEPSQLKLPFVRTTSLAKATCLDLGVTAELVLCLVVDRWGA